MKSANVATRRRFLLSASAALSAPAALAVASESTARTRDGETLEARLAALEDTNAIRALQRAYARHLNAQARAAAAQLFAEPAQARFDDAIRGLTAEAMDEQDQVQIAADRRTATARLPCTVRTETPIEAPGCTLVEMARLQGEGVVRRSERRVLEQDFVRRDGVWRIARVLIRESSAGGGLVGLPAFSATN